MKKTLLCIGLFVSLVPAMLFADVMWENDLAIRSSVEIDWNGCSAPVADGGVIYVWCDRHDNSRNIYAQKVNAQGNMVWTTPMDVAAGEFAQAAPVIVTASDGNFIIIYSQSSMSNNSDLYAQKITAEGQRLWQEGGMPVCTAEGSSGNVKVVKDNYGGVFIAWDDNRVSDCATFVQHIDNQGNSLWQVDGINVYPTVLNTLSSIIQDGADGIIVSYYDEWELPYVTDWDIFIKRYDVAGNPVWANPVAIGSTIEDETFRNCQLLMLNDSEFMAVWQYSSNYGHSNVFAQRYSTSGVAVWDSPIGLNDDITTGMYLQQIALVNNGIIIDLLRDLAGMQQVTLQKVSLDGQIMWDMDTTECDISNPYVQMMHSKIIPDNIGGCYFAWADYASGSDYSTPEIRVQHISNSGHKTWGEEGVLLCDSDRAQEMPSVVLSGSHIFVGWKDARQTAVGIYYQMLTTSGITQLEAGGRVIMQGLNSLGRGDRVTLSRTNDVVVIWDDDRGYTDTGFYMQSINPDGTVNYAENGVQIVAANGNNQYYQTAMVTAAGDVLFLWEDVGSPSTLRMQLVTADGIPQWGLNGRQVAELAEGVAWDQYTYVSSAGNDIYVAWSAVYMGAKNNHYRVWGQRINNGQPQWGTYGIMIRDYDPYDAGITFRLFGLEGSCFAWSENTGTDHQILIKAKLVNPDGTPAQGWSIEGNTVNNPIPGILTLTYGNSLRKMGNNYLVVWNDHGIGSGAEDLSMGQMLSANGVLQWGQDGVLLNEETAILCSSRIYAYDDYFIFLRNRHTDNGYFLTAKAFDNTGNSLWTSDLIGMTTDYSQYYSLNKMPSGSYTVVWDAPSASNPNGNCIKYNYLSAQGEVYNDQGGYLITDSTGELYMPQTGLVGNDIYICWGEAGYYRDNINTLYVQKINNPYVGNQDDTDIVSAMITDFTGYPNPFKKNTTLSLTAKDNVTAEIAIYNVRGQKVRTLHQGSLTTGRHQLQWDGLDSNGSQVSTGVYFCRIKANGTIQSRKLLMVK